jgi:hypothetical protein
MTEVQWRKVTDRLHKYREVRMPDGDILILWDNGDVSLRSGEDGHCIICATTLEQIKRIYVDPQPVEIELIDQVPDMIVEPVEVPAPVIPEDFDI